MRKTLSGIALGLAVSVTPSFAQTTTTNLIGAATGFAAGSDTMPDAFIFSQRTGINPNGVRITSNGVIIGGISEPVNVSVSDMGTGGDPKISVNGGPFTNGPAQVSDGDRLEVSIFPTFAGFDATYRAQITVGDGSAIFQVTTRGADTTPDSFAFTASSNQDPGVVVQSADATITGIETSVSVSVAGTGSPEISFDGGTTWTTSGTISENGTLRVRLTSGNFGEIRTAQVNVGDGSGSFSVTTRSSNDTPILTAFVDQTGVEPAAVVVSAPITVSGLQSTATGSVSGMGSPEIRVNGGAWTAAGQTVSIVNNDTVEVRLTSGTFGEIRDVILNVNGVSDTFSVTVRAADLVPDAFAFDPVTGASPGATVVSGSAIPAGFEDSASVTILGDGSPEFSTDDGATWIPVGQTGTLALGDAILLRLTSGSYGEERTATVTVGGVSASFVVTARTQDVTPAPFTFSAQSVAPSTEVTSGPVLLTGFEGSVAISVSGQGGPSYSLDGVSFTSDAGTVVPGSSVWLRMTSSATENAVSTAKLTVGGSNADLVVTSYDQTPDAFTLTPVTGAALNVAVKSGFVTMAGFGAPVAITITGDGSPTYSIDGAAFVSGPGTISAGQTVEVKLTSAGAYETQRQATLTVGGVARVFSVTTGSEPVVVALATGAIPDAEKGQAYVGFDFATLASVSGGPAADPAVAADLIWSVTGGSLPAGLSLSSAGLLSGTTTAVGGFTFTVSATAGGTTDVETYSIIVNDPNGSLIIEAG